MRVIHVVPSVATEASGHTYSVVRLCESLIEAGTDASLVTLDSALPHKKCFYVSTFRRGIGPRRLGASPAMRRWLDRNASSGRLDIIHNHSLWMMPNVYGGWTCRRHRGCRLVVSPRGTLSQWALRFHALRKKVFWYLLQRSAVRDAACFHATADLEYFDIRARGFTQPVCVIPNGIDVPPLDRPDLEDRRRLLFLGRIHPIKGVDILLHAWRAVQNRFPNWHLHVAGPADAGLLPKMEALAADIGANRVEFMGPVYGEDKLRAYRSAALFVLPTHSENFGNAVAEALAAGTPVIVTTGAPWSGLKDEGAGWWIDIGVDPLVACLEQALACSPETLAQMGLAGRRWMMRDYNWRRIGEQCAVTYRWLLEGGEVPAWVRLH